jgi:hypothetical protein
MRKSQLKIYLQLIILRQGETDGEEWLNGEGRLFRRQTILGWND